MEITFYSLKSHLFKAIFGIKHLTLYRWGIYAFKIVVSTEFLFIPFFLLKLHPLNVAFLYLLMGDYRLA